MVAGGGPEQLVVLANRLPVERVAVGDGGSGWRTTTGGLVTLLEPVVRDTRAIWVGYAGTSQPSTLDHDGLRMFVVGLPEADFPGYYEGYANSTIWPLYHDCVSPPAFRRDWWESYVRVNEHFADTAAAQAAGGGTVWVNDYHLQLVPALLRGRRPDLRVGFFLHVPVPEAEVFRRLPQREQILRGICGADLVGVQCASSAGCRAPMSMTAASWSTGGGCGWRTSPPRSRWPASRPWRAGSTCGTGGRRFARRWVGPTRRPWRAGGRTTRQGSC